MKKVILLAFIIALYSPSSLLAEGDDEYYLVFRRSITELLSEKHDIRHFGQNSPLLQDELYQKENIDLLECVLAAHADPNGMREDGITPLDLAIIAKNSRAVELLLRAGADPLMEDGHGENALMVVQRYEAQDVGVLSPAESEELICLLVEYAFPDERTKDHEEMMPVECLVCMEEGSAETVLIDIPCENRHSEQICRACLADITECPMCRKPFPKA